MLIFLYNFVSNLTSNCIYIGLWRRVKIWLNSLGGTRDSHIQLRLDEFRFHDMYLRPDRDAAMWIMLCVLGQFGRQATERFRRHRRNGDRYPLIP